MYVCTSVRVRCCPFGRGAGLAPPPTTSWWCSRCFPRASASRRSTLAGCGRPARAAAAASGSALPAMATLSRVASPRFVSPQTWARAEERRLSRRPWSQTSFFSIHIPKTAGTSLSLDAPALLPAGAQLTRREVCFRHGAAALVGGGSLSDYPATDRAGKRTSTLVMLREPRAHVISQCKLRAPIGCRRTTLPPNECLHGRPRMPHGQLGPQGHKGLTIPARTALGSGIVRVAAAFYQRHRLGRGS